MKKESGCQNIVMISNSRTAWPTEILKLFFWVPWIILSKMYTVNAPSYKCPPLYETKLLIKWSKITASKFISYDISYILTKMAPLHLQKIEK